METDRQHANQRPKTESNFIVAINIFQSTSLSCARFQIMPAIDDTDNECRHLLSLRVVSVTHQFYDFPKRNVRNISDAKE